MAHIKEFEAIYKEYFKRVYSYFYRKNIGPQTSLELTQETFLRVYTNMKYFRGECPVAFWIFKIAHNLFCSKLKSEKSRIIAREGIEKAKQISSKSPDIENELTRKHQLARLAISINELPKMTQRCIKFHYYHELSYKEIALMLNISVNTVKTHLREGIKKMKAKAPALSIIK